MRFVWDEEKSDRNLADRGFDFAFAAVIFASPILERIDLAKSSDESFGPSE